MVVEGYPTIGSTSQLQPRSASAADRRVLLDNQAKEAAQAIKSAVSRNASLLLISHFDADGLSAGSITLASVSRLGTSAHLRIVENMTDPVLEEIAKIESDLVVFSDIGSGYIPSISKILQDKEIVIADHHQSVGEPPRNIHHLNPHLLGFDGATEVSGAGTAYILAKALDPANVDLSPLAIVGCLGDQQDKGPKRAMIGLNAEILKDATSTKLVEATQDLIFYGRQTRPIHKAIATTTSPFLPGLSGEEDKCLALLDSANIQTKVDDRWRTVSDLSVDEKRRLVDRIVQYMIGLKLSGEVALDLIGTVYTLTREDPWTPLKDGREYSSLLNACGRMQRPSLGVALGLGDRGAVFEEAQAVYKDYRKSLAKYMGWITENPSVLKQLGPLVIVRGEGVIPEGMTGAVSSLVSSSNLFGDKRVTIVVSNTKNGEVKLSTRGTDYLVSKGLNLGRTLQSLCEKYGGNGGGHTIAAGATVDPLVLDKFLKELAAAVEAISS